MMRHGRITMGDVARAAGVSPMTVSNAYRYPERVQDETRRRILEVAADLGYVPNLAAGSLAAGQSRVIGGAIPSMRNSSFYRYILGMQHAVADAGYKLVLMLAEGIEQERQAVQTLVGLRVEGIVLVGNEHHSDTASLLSKTATPVVESWALEDAMDMCVGYDTAEATRAMVRLHASHGRRRIALIVYEGAVSRRFKMRIPAYEQQMRALGLTPDLVQHVQETDGFGAGPRALDALLQRAPDLDAVICPTDIIAAGAVFECGRRGIDVPGRIAVSGWGDYEIASEMTPGLTTIQPNAWEIGEAAIRMIVQRQRGRPPAEPATDTGFDILRRASA